MKTYSKFQTGWLIIITFTPILILMYLSYKYQWGNNPLNLTAFIILEIIMAASLLLFYGLRVSVDDTKIKVAFGIGLISKTIRINEIKSVEVVRNPWYYGWGIRIIPGGWLYNVSGWYAVELKFKNSKKVFRIGTANPQDLKNAIESRLIPEN